jgi:hypothetical protein
MILIIKVKVLPHGKDLPLPKYMSEHAAIMPAGGRASGQL